MNEPSPPLFPFVEEDQRDTAQRLGLWTFLATEILFFGGLLTIYAIYRHAYPAAFAIGSHKLDFWIGTINTAVLLTSSLGMALGDHALRQDHRRALQACLVVTWLLGATFLLLKGVEYHHKFTEHLVPGAHFQAGGPFAPQVQLFIFIYFALTGLHAVHMIGGLIALSWLLWLNGRGRLSRERRAPVAMVGLYWHFVDSVWVFLYPLLYLVVQ